MEKELRTDHTEELAPLQLEEGEKDYIPGVNSFTSESTSACSGLSRLSSKDSGLGSAGDTFCSSFEPPAKDLKYEIQPPHRLTSLFLEENGMCFGYELPPLCESSEEALRLIEEETRLLLLAIIPNDHAWIRKRNCKIIDLEAQLFWMGSPLTRTMKRKIDDKILGQLKPRFLHYSGWLKVASQYFELTSSNANTLHGIFGVWSSRLFSSRFQQDLVFQVASLWLLASRAMTPEMISQGGALREVLKAEEGSPALRGREREVDWLQTEEPSLNFWSALLSLSETADDSLDPDDIPVSELVQGLAEEALEELKARSPGFSAVVAQTLDAIRMRKWATCEEEDAEEVRRAEEQQMEDLLHALEPLRSLRADEAESESFLASFFSLFHGRTACSGGRKGGEESVRLGIPRVLVRKCRSGEFEV